MKERLDSGAIIDVSTASVRTCYKLLQAVAQEFKKNGIDIKLELDDDISNLGALIVKNSGAFLSGLIDVVSSNDVMDILFECAASGYYEKNGVKRKISWDCFEEEDTREDFFEVMIYILKRNLSPFFPKRLIKSKATQG